MFKLIFEHFISHETFSNRTKYLNLFVVPRKRKRKEIEEEKKLL